MKQRGNLNIPEKSDHHQHVIPAGPTVYFHKVVLQMLQTCDMKSNIMEDNVVANILI